MKIFSELLDQHLRGRLDEQDTEYLSHLRNGAGRLEALVKDLLSYTQVSHAGKPDERQSAGEALKAALASLYGTIAESGAVVESAQLPAVPVHGPHLQLVFQNLIGNAIKYHRPGVRPKIDVSARRQDGYWVFAVRDNGIGIEPEYREAIFGLFKRLHHHDQYGGTGIGLAICKRIVERYYGRIWVESQAGAGSTFFFTLPA